MVVACISPGAKLKQQARSLNALPIDSHSTQFAHQSFFFSVNQSHRSTWLHVYIEGDGKPWVNRYNRAIDPTSRQPFMLEAAAIDLSDSLYLGRPCYNDQFNSLNCHSDYWTTARYSTNVIESMAFVLNRFITKHGYENVAIFGHSGGGSLAMLLPKPLMKMGINTKLVVTLAGNLDIDLWTDYHEYSPLSTSLNPANELRLPHSIKQVHFIAGKDNNIPYKLVSAELERQTQSNNLEVIHMKHFNHHCCWLEQWPNILNQIEGFKRTN